MAGRRDTRLRRPRGRPARRRAKTAWTAPECYFLSRAEKSRRLSGARGVPCAGGAGAHASLALAVARSRAWGGRARVFGLRARSGPQPLDCRCAVARGQRAWSCGEALFGIILTTLSAPIIWRDPCITRLLTPAVTQPFASIRFRNGAMHLDKHSANCLLRFYAFAYINGTPVAAATLQIAHDRTLQAFSRVR